MITYTLKKEPGLPLYESLYRALREDILSGRLPAGEKLPSKRALAEHLKVSKTTVETAYSQLAAEGYLRSREKVGCFVEQLPCREAPAAPPPAFREAVITGDPGHFPFSRWSKLQRSVILDRGQQLLLPMPSMGVPELRSAIAAHLADFRGMTVRPENILIGAGTDFLCNLLPQLLGKDRPYALEEPGYGKIRKIYLAAGARCVPAPMDDAGVLPDSLGDAGVLHISPSHHYPTGVVTSMERRRELLRWAREGQRWIIEDDYDSEFRPRPMAAMQSMDPERVIYMNTFSKSLAPSIRISYLVLPESLTRRFREELGFYGCTVPSFEQYTLARLLSEGDFEKHINRMRKFYRARRARLIAIARAYPGFTVLERDAGLHFLLQGDAELPDEKLSKDLPEGITPLSAFCHGPKQDLHCLVVNYTALEEDAFRAAMESLSRRVRK